VEQAVIEEALRRAQGNQTVAARLLGLSRRALNNRLQRSPSGEEPSG
jgi:DNA-binding NtrC family response regulator